MIRQVFAPISLQEVCPGVKSTSPDDICLPGVPLVESPFFYRQMDHRDWEPELQRIAVDLHERGFAVLDFPETDFSVLAEDAKRAIDAHFDRARWRAADREPRLSFRVRHAWRTNEAIRKIACNRTLRKLISALYGRRAFPFQTINFPVGSQQHLHTDVLHIAPHPQGFLCAVWVAFEDVDEENGPLVVFPGSHKLSYFGCEHVGSTNDSFADVYRDYPKFEALWETLVRLEGLEPLAFHARAGQAVIMTANLLHGGALHRNPARTRYSQVTHYFFEDCAYYVPLTSHPFHDRITYRPVTDISTGFNVPPMYQGMPIHPTNPEFVEE